MAAPPEGGSDPATTKRVAVGRASHRTFLSSRNAKQTRRFPLDEVASKLPQSLSRSSEQKLDPGEPGSAPIPRRQPDRAPPAVGTPCTGTILTSAMLSGHEREIGSCSKQRYWGWGF